MTNNVLHENDNYKVVHAADSTVYVLINKTTMLSEMESKSLPEIIGHAEQSNAYLKYNAWKYIDEQVRQQVDWAALQFGPTALADGGPKTPPDGTSGSNLLN